MRRNCPANARRMALDFNSSIDIIFLRPAAGGRRRNQVARRRRRREMRRRPIPCGFGRHRRLPGRVSIVCRLLVSSCAAAFAKRCSLQTWPLGRGRASFAAASTRWRHLARERRPIWCHSAGEWSAKMLRDMQIALAKFVQVGPSGRSFFLILFCTKTSGATHATALPSRGCIIYFPAR